ncbi:hypothetical protein Q8791_21600 [Nocardiopsis sp. CT-R113]|uniref:Integral membrane protein n=1 Tax=Nocardiopsis codii TaxID=3065942 RepID=A0ABU7KC59_9ACTN|nr:hypothetical protein [Nocardiopsis sp. CT-R113]MEE2039816.1 hypothetical protein [Nocardiopsis sp. CT-R113]
MTERSPRELLVLRAALAMMVVGALILLVWASPLLGEPRWPYMLFAVVMLVVAPVNYRLIRRRDRVPRSGDSPESP